MLDNRGVKVVFAFVGIVLWLLPQEVLGEDVEIKNRLSYISKVVGVIEGSIIKIEGDVRFVKRQAEKTIAEAHLSAKRLDNLETKIKNIENLLKTSPFVSQAMVYGDAKPYLTALITMDEDEITKFARDRKLLYKDQADLSKKEEVLELYRQEVHFKNEKLASYETIKKFFVLEEDFDQDKDELTPTLKVRRKVVTERYKSILEKLYK